MAPCPFVAQVFGPMKLERFELERNQSEWEHHVDYNLSESGVEPLHIRDLLDTKELKDQLLWHCKCYVLHLLVNIATDAFHFLLPQKIYSF